MSASLSLTLFLIRAIHSIVHPLRGPAHDGELGWGGWQARGLGGTYLKRPGAGDKDPGTLRPPRRKAVGLLSFEATAEELSIQRRSPAGLRALYQRSTASFTAGTPRRAAPAPPFP